MKIVCFEWKDTFGNGVVKVERIKDDAFKINMKDMEENTEQGGK